MLFFLFLSLSSILPLFLFRLLKAKEPPLSIYSFPRARKHTHEDPLARGNAELVEGKKREEEGDREREKQNKNAAAAASDRRRGRGGGVNARLERPHNSVRGAARRLVRRRTLDVCPRQRPRRRLDGLRCREEAERERRGRRRGKLKKRAFGRSTDSKNEISKKRKVKKCGSR